MKLENLLKFVQFTNNFRAVDRDIFATGTSRKENDAEHTFQLIATAIYLVESCHLPYNLEKVIVRATVHDFAETYAGDRHFLDEVGRNGKEERETEAVARIHAEFPEWRQFPDIVQNYMSQEDPESIFVWTLDKFIPLLNIFLDDGKTWKRDGTGLDVLLANKDPKLKREPFIYNLFLQWVELARQHPELFP